MAVTRLNWLNLNLKLLHQTELAVALLYNLAWGEPSPFIEYINIQLHRLAEIEIEKFSEAVLN